MVYEQAQPRTVQKGHALAKAPPVVESFVALRAIRNSGSERCRYRPRGRGHGECHPVLDQEAQNKDSHDAGSAGLEALGRLWGGQPHVEQVWRTKPKLEGWYHGGSAVVLRELGMENRVRCGVEAGQGDVPPMWSEMRRLAGHADAHSPHRAVCDCSVTSRHQEPRAAVRSVSQVYSLEEERAT